MMESSQPVVPATATLPEITVKAVVLSIILAAVLAAANAYLGLFAGMTVSASIPAAVVSMAILRLFRRANILENNIVQTAASSGEALAAGVIFTIPALVLVGYWPTFDYWQTAAIAGAGGLLGVLFTIPLRRALIIEASLRFPEGVATAEVLKIGSGSTISTDARTLLSASLLAGMVKVAEAGFRLWSEALEGAARIGGSVLYLGINLSPALVAVGFIIGLRTALVVCLGGVLAWVVLMPLYGLLYGIPADGDAITAAKLIWSRYIRYVGIGAMLVGGFWTLVQLRKPVIGSLRHVLASHSLARKRLMPMAPDASGTQQDKSVLVPRTERDASPVWLVTLTGASLIAMGLIYTNVAGSGLVGALMTLIMAVAAFLFSSVAAYMAGLVGSSSNPVSGVTIATLMLAALLLVLFLGQTHPSGPAAALAIAAVVCCAAAMGGDNLQDLKTGHLVGATPWKQQVMQVVGVVTGAVVIVPVLRVLQAKYGIGEITPDHPYPLSAPQATLMASLARAVFGDALPWPLVGLGALIGALVIGFDRHQAVRGASFRMPVLAVALGMYLPLKLSAAILAGGVIAALSRNHAAATKDEAPRQGLLFAAGLVTGEALMGVLLALPIVLASVWPSMGADPLKLFDRPPLGAWPGVMALAGVASLLYLASCASRPVNKHA